MDFEYDLSMWEEGKIRPTKQLAAMLKDYGGFPESVLVRQENASSACDVFFGQCVNWFPVKN